MDRAEKAGLGVAAVGHIIVFGLLSATWLATRPQLPPPPPSLDVSLVDEVGLEAQAPAATDAPAPSVAPEIGKPEDAPPPAKLEAAPEPAPPKPQPAPAPPPKPAAVSKPAPPKPAPPAPKQAAAPAKPAAAAKPTQVPAKAAGTNVAATTPRPRGGRLGADFLKGIVAEPSPGKAETPRAAKIDARALAGLQDAISRQIQPCADRQVVPGPGANEIVTRFNVRLNRDGSLAATPQPVGPQVGVDDGNSRYAQRVIDLGVAAFKGCTPLRLPPELYQTSAGGWSNFIYKWKLK